MTIQGAMKQLEEMREHPMMPVVFKPLFDKVIETIADEFAPTKDDIYWGYTATIDRPLADKEIVFRLRAIQKQIGGSYAIDRAIEVIEEVQELFERHGHVAGGNKKDVTDTNVGNKGGLIEKQAAIDAVERNACNTQRAIEAIETLPSAQPEHDDEVTFWEKRANEYEAMLGELMTKIAKGMTVDSIVINKDGIVFKESQPERPKGEWVGVHAYCDHLNEEAKVNGKTERYIPSGMVIGVYCNKCWCRADKKSDFCPNCGSDNRGEQDE